MGAFCRRHAYRGGKSPAELIARLRAAPAAPIGLPAATVSASVAAQVDLLRALQAAITNIERVIADRVAAHPRARLLDPLPGVGIINSLNRQAVLPALSDLTGVQINAVDIIKTQFPNRHERLARAAANIQ